MRVHGGILLAVLCTGVALAGSQLARGQDAPSGNFEEHSQPAELTPTPSPGKDEASKPSVEISGAMPSRKPSPVAKHTPRAEEPAATPTATAEKKTHLKTHATPAAQPTAAESPVAITEKKTGLQTHATPTAQPTAAESPASIIEKIAHLIKPRATPAPQPSAAESPVAGPMSISAAKALAVSAPLPEYPLQARRAKITGSGLCVLLVDTASGKVTSATMEESTGNKILDRATIETFRRWRFKPGTVSQLRVPISYQ